jgi:hypothetical protein
VIQVLLISNIVMDILHRIQQYRPRSRRRIKI